MTKLWNGCIRQIFLLAVMIFITHGQSTPDTALPKIEKPGLHPVLTALKTKPSLRLAIPKMLPKAYADKDEFYCTVMRLKSDEYEVIIGYTVDCGGGNACRLGSLYGKNTGQNHITGTGDYPFERERAKPVQLRQGIKGYFIDSTCGANCSDSKIFWTVNGWEYMVGLKAGKLSQVKQFANSAIGP
ncbi:MAG TPA: hypothetical protein PLD20_25925 [Blastocatellia bacterium]|nr:hypothetical protein [Blastocatellia bacterium]HMX25132.1 hypothetical protein [Blastocatellia bacterium]HMY75580.1 hypothetical protein [Blastocatellia bacterium]HMZ21398.1 hypothetical protein [Blastocatellia bacterium]HNG32730.1 hypothetical protein [Blastocatellia bacterium]